MESQNRIGHLERVFELHSQNGDVGRHPWKKLAIGIVNGDHNIISDHILRNDRRLANIGNHPVKCCVRVGSTVNTAFCPTAILPTSDSSTLVSTCIFVRSCAISKIVGGLREEATV